jgi:putative hydrolase of the HAD superfamily
MVGNSLRSDVVPVVELGARAVHIPYHVTWHHEQVAADSLPGEGWFKLERISDLAPLLGTLDGPPRRSVRHKLQSRPDRKRKRD